MATQKTYLGDSVYIELDAYGIILSTNNGQGSTNTIYLDPPVCEKLMHYINDNRKFLNLPLFDSNKNSH